MMCRSRARPAHSAFKATLWAADRSPVAARPDLETRTRSFSDGDATRAGREGAWTDRLTGAGSLRRLEREVEAGIHGSAAVHIDLDRFDEINDRYGHDVGDDVLREVSYRLVAIVRPTDLVIRVGGDEFVLVIRSVSEFDGIGIAARIVDELARPYQITRPDSSDPLLVAAPASVGLCVQGDATPFELALTAADEALASAKQAGRCRMHIVSR